MLLDIYGGHREVAYGSGWSLLVQLTLIGAPVPTYQT